MTDLPDNWLETLEELERKATKDWIAGKSVVRYKLPPHAIKEMDTICQCYTDYETNVQLIAAMRNALPELIRRARVYDELERKSLKIMKEAQEKIDRCNIDRPSWLKKQDSLKYD